MFSKNDDLARWHTLMWYWVTFSPLWDPSPELVIGLRLENGQQHGPEQNATPIGVSLPLVSL